MERINSKTQLIRMMREYKHLVFSICLKLTGDYFTAEDLTQETFLLVYEHLQGFDGSNEKSWICRIATNLCIDYQRKEKRIEPGIISEAEQEPDPEKTLFSEGRCPSDPAEEVSNAMLMKELQHSCECLKEPYRSISIAHFVRGQTAKEIAFHADVPLKTVQTRLRRAREQLKQILRKEDLLG